MNIYTRLAAAIILGSVGALCFNTDDAKAQRQMERLGRGVVAINQGDKVFVSWRLLGTDSPNTAFNLYRATANAAPIKLNAAPLTGATNFVDNARPRADTKYFVRVVQNNREGAQST